jgi:ATP-dependent exoDNAse (exonuclease V) beta subunit
VQDNETYAYRTYYDAEGYRYASVTNLIQETSDNTALENWYARLGETAIQVRDTAASRGTLTHDRAEYLLKTARKLAIHSANNRGVFRLNEHGLFTPPSKLTTWALKKTLPQVPEAKLHSYGYTKSLLEWILENVTAIHACEFSSRFRFDPFIRENPVHGFAGTCDGLLGINGTTTIVDWKTSDSEMYPDKLLRYTDQLGAYRLGLHQLTGLWVNDGMIVCAKRIGPPEVVKLDKNEMQDASQRYLNRCNKYLTDLGSNFTLVL